jgi:hypothetical protein
VAKIVKLEQDEFGFEIILPSWLVFFDEVGSNTSQANDGNFVGQTVLCTKGSYQACTLYHVVFHISKWCTYYVCNNFCCANNEE